MKHLLIIGLCSLTTLYAQLEASSSKSGTGSGEVADTSQPADVIVSSKKYTSLKVEVNQQEHGEKSIPLQAPSEELVPVNGTDKKFVGKPEEE